MNLDFNLDNNLRFNARCSAIIYNKDKSKILIFKTEGNNYYMLPGGRIEFNESSIEAIKREIKEEIGFDLEYKLLSIQENFVIKNNIEIMQYAFCYEGIYLGKDKSNFNSLDNSSQTFYWISINEIDKYNIFPRSSIALIKKRSENIEHIIERVS